LLRNEACGVAYADVLLREGLYPGYKAPVVPGYEAVGRVAAAGADVDGVREGDYCAALTVVGGYASHVIVPAADLVAVPEGLAPEVAASLVLNGITAYQMLERCAPAQLRTIAVFGAGGGVGSILLDLARHRGLTVFGFAGTAKHAAIFDKGATPLDRADALAALRAVAPQGVDAVFDGVGGSTTRAAFSMLGTGGVLVLFGAQGIMSAGRRNLVRATRELIGMPWWSALHLFRSDRGVIGYTITTRKAARPDQYRADLAAVFDLAVAGVIAPLIDTVYDLSEAQSAHVRMNDARHTGKIVLRTPEERAATSAGSQ
jgi:NADPH:quinone reductase-like Zn-dependent oxidoreductase